MMPFITILRCRFCGLYLPSLLALLCLSKPAWAFPAPDLVINLFGSAAQLLGMLGASLGAAWLGFAKPGQTQQVHSIRLGLYVLSAALMASIAVNAWQYWQQQEDQARRLQSHLLHPSPPTHPIKKELAISRADFQAWFENRQAYQLIDVREPEEFELGQIPGARNSRYADLLSRDLSSVRRDIPNVLVCDSGFRSGEICTRLQQMGFPCRYIDGGYGKWVSEKRAMQFQHPGQRGAMMRLQALPDYANQNVLLDTPQVAALIEHEGARFLDVRSLAEFQHKHLANAIHLPVREETSASLTQAIKQLPHVPLIAACYDNRSCFYSKVIGLRLSRLGFDYRGRYTVPEEYPIPARLNHSLALRKLQTYSASAMQVMTYPARALLQVLQPYSVVLAILMLAIVVRLICLPAALLAERERRQMPFLLAQSAAWQSQFQLDARVQQAAWRSLLKRARISPLRNLLFALLQLLLLSSCLAALHEVVEQLAQANPALAYWAKLDASYSLAGLISLTIALYLWRLFKQGNQPMPWWQWGLILLSAALLGFACADLSLALNVYLLASLVLLLVQQFCIKKDPPQTLSATLGKRTPMLRLSQAHAVAPTKARSLAHMRRANLPVPNGLVLDADLYRPAQHQTRLHLALLPFGLQQRFAVRSAAGDEDSAFSSQAGRYLSLLNVEKSQLAQAIAEVSRVMQASHSKGNSIIVQTMLDAEYAGVLFTEHPNNSGQMLLEFAAGSGAVVAGNDQPRALCIGRVSGIVRANPAEGDKLSEQGAGLAPIDLSALWELAKRIEALFGAPQDIEWAYCQRRFYILQARPITRRIVDGNTDHAIRERERQRLLALLQPQLGRAAEQPHPTQAWLVLDDAAAELPQASRLSLSLLERLHGPGGAVDLAWQSLGFDYLSGVIPHWTSAFGQTRLLKQDASAAQLRPSLLAQLGFARKVDALALAYQEQFLPVFRQQMRYAQALDLSQLSLSEVQTLMLEQSEDFIQRIYLHAERLNLAAKLYADAALRMLQKRGLDPSMYLRAERATPDLAAMHALLALRQGKLTMQDFLQQFGHRSGHDFELSQARYSEMPDWLAQWQSSLPEKLPQHAALPAAPKGRLLAAAVQRAQRYIYLKEDAKHECARALANLRRLLLEIDRRHGLANGIFAFSFNELAQGILQQAPLVETRLAEQARKQAAFAEWPLAQQVSIGELEQLNLMQADTSGATTRGQTNGQFVAGRRVVRGRVCLRRDAGSALPLADNCILVVPSADPAWITYFTQVAGIICETGGMLCHAAIMARECDLPAIFGAHNALQTLREGDEIEMQTDGSIIKLA